MATFRINKNQNYTIMSNVHLQQAEMSLKAKGILSVMLSLPDDWDYSIAGLVKMSKDGKDSVVSALLELEKLGYLKRTQQFDSKGHFAGYIYDIYEQPFAEKPLTEKPHTENPLTEKPTQQNTNITNNIYNTKRQNTKKQKGNVFVSPTIEEVKVYCQERKNNVDAEAFVNFYESKGWYVGKNKMKDWQAAVRTWEKNRKQQTNNNIYVTPQSYDSEAYKRKAQSVPKYERKK